MIIIIFLADLIIAAHAKEHNLTLVTKDKLFKKIDEIRTIILD
ncbi:PIN domain-containing protein [Candidatus Woesearchaeota archaeon]|nr:PIN domain-containing protein [Candidatus Woesearchaeota archaeon]